MGQHPCGARLALCLACAAAACNPTPPSVLVVRAGRLLDGSGAPAQEGMRLTVRDGSVVSLEPDSEPFAPPPDAAVLDARGLTVMPGLVDSHVHVFSAGACHLSLGAGPFQGLRSLHALLAGGVTTAADLASPAWLAVAMRRHVGTARHRGPRLLVAGPLLTVPGGYPSDMGGEETFELGVAQKITSVADARRAVRQLAAAEVDLIKVAVQERSFNEKPIPMLQGEPLCAVVEEAHRQKLRVFAHAMSAPGWRAALACKVDVLAHASLDPLGDDLLAEAKTARIPFIPTLFTFEAPSWGPAHLPELEARPGVGELVSSEVLEDLKSYAVEFASGGEALPPYIVPGIQRVALERGVASAAANTRALHDAGVPLGLGSDSPFCFILPGTPVQELLRLQGAGLPPLEVLRVATSGGAALLGLQDALGLLRVGYRADLIAVEGRPDERLEDVANVRHVVIDGVEQELGPPGLKERVAFLFRLVWAYLRS